MKELVNKEYVRSSNHGKYEIKHFLDFHDVKLTNLSFEEEDSQWLLIQKAKEEEVLKIEFKLPNDAVKELLKVCNDAYLKGSEGTSAHLWNEQRKLILHDKISTILLPSMEKEGRALLNGKAKKILIIEIWDAILEQKVCHEFLTIHQPKVIVLGAAIVSCIRLRKYFNERHFRGRGNIDRDPCE
ncbi:hypothetical protein P8452_08999 [Trifolium repens]|nr:hypothetical protein P8452_08999 [Trifolium repens]